MDRHDVAEKANASQSSGGIDVQQVFADSATLAAQFDKLCSDFACPEQARVYGTNYDVMQDSSTSPCGYVDSGNAAPRKGSLRVFAQQVLLVVATCACCTHTHDEHSHL